MEPLEYLRSIDYSRYSGSIWWKSRAEAYLQTRRVERRGEPLECDLCGEWESSDAVGHWKALPMHVHHREYVRLAAELDEDLVLLCEPCHNLVHKEWGQQGKYHRARLEQRLGESVVATALENLRPSWEDVYLRWLEG